MMLLMMMLLILLRSALSVNFVASSHSLIFSFFSALQKRSHFKFDLFSFDCTCNAIHCRGRGLTQSHLLPGQCLVTIPSETLVACDPCVSKTNPLTVQLPTQQNLQNNLYFCLRSFHRIHVCCELLRKYLHLWKLLQNFLVSVEINVPLCPRAI